jgi:MFS family permease
LTYWREFRISGTTLLGAAIGLALGSALNHYASNLFGPALLKEFGWSKAELAYTQSFGLLTIPFVPLAGWVADRFGPRLAALIGFTMVPLTYLLYSMMTGPIWQYYAITMLHQMFGVLTTTLVFTRVIVQRFDAARGMALSILMTGAPLAAAIFIPVLGGIIEDDGWRSGYHLMAMLTLAAGAIAILTMGKDRSEAVERPRLTLAKFIELTSHPGFVLLIAGMVLVNIPQSIVGGQLNLLMIDNGASTATAIWLASLYPMAVIVGRFLSGLALDKIATYIVALFALGLPALGYTALATSFDPLWLLAGAILLIGLAQGAEGDLGAYIASKLFGHEHFSFVYSFLIVSMGLANAIGATVLGFSLARTNSYNIFLIVCAVATLAGALAFVMAAKRDAANE